MHRVTSMIVAKPKDASADPFAADAPQAAILYREAGERSFHLHVVA